VLARGWCVEVGLEHDEGILLQGKLQYVQQKANRSMRPTGALEDRTARKSLSAGTPCARYGCRARFRKPQVWGSNPQDGSKFLKVCSSGLQLGLQSEFAVELVPPVACCYLKHLTAHFWAALVLHRLLRHLPSTRLALGRAHHYSPNRT
jgi:hypothetical protein